MKRAGVVYRQYRQIRKLTLIRALSAARQKIHDNCHYGRTVQYYELDGHSSSVRLCMFKPDDPTVCTNPYECNAFARKWSDEMVMERFSMVMKDESIKKRLFPELWVYEWVLDKPLTDAYKSEGRIARIIIWMISVLERVLKIFSAKKDLPGQGEKSAKT